MVALVIAVFVVERTGSRVSLFLMGPRLIRKHH